MDDLKKEKIEALEVLKDYTVKLTKGIETIIPELKGEKKEDTDDFLKQIISGINWVIEVLNRTMDIINSKEEHINKEKVNKNIINFSNAIKSSQDSKIAEALESNIVPFLNELNSNLVEVL